MASNVIVGQSGGPTAVINASLAGVYEAAKAMGAPKVYGMRYGVQGLLAGKTVYLGEHFFDPIHLELLKRTPSSFLGSCRYKLPDMTTQPELYEKLFAILNKMDVGYFFYIGGNDSMDTILSLIHISAGRRAASHLGGFLPRVQLQQLGLRADLPGAHHRVQLLLCGDPV